MGNDVSYHVSLTGLTPLLMHKDNIDFSSAVSKWQKDPQNKKTSIAGDDRSPAWTWIGYLYTDTSKENGKIIIDSDNIMTLLRESGAKMNTGHGKATFKKVTQYGLYVDGMYFTFRNNGQEISKDWINALVGETDFDKHLEAVASHGFELLVKRAKIGMGARAAKHVRVRPMFRNWSAEGTITVVDPQESGLTQEVLQRILDIGGGQVGLCDWRPSSPNAGPYGKFSAAVVRL